jgi:hypothetical protein
MAYTTNGLTIEAYYLGSSNRALIPDPKGLLNIAYGLNFSTGFPGGLYLDCSFYVPRKLASYWQIRGANVIVIRNGLKTVYEGKIDNLAGNAEEGGAEGTEVQVTGYWGALAMRYAIRKRWADKRITEDVWKYVTTYPGAEKCTVDRNNRIRFTPKAVAWTTDQFAAVRLTMPTGRTAKRITFNATLDEGGQVWGIYVYNIADGANEYSRTSDGTDSNQDVTIDTASQSIELRFTSLANQTPTSDGAIYGQFSNITVYDELGAINALEIGYDLIGACSELSTSLTGVYDGLAGETLPALDQFAFDDFTPIADIATAAAAYGNTSDESIYFQVRSSEDAETNDGKPLLAAGVYPDLTSADYVVRLSGQNVVSASINRDYSNIRNWIAVNYMDEKNERQVISPDDAGYTALTDAISTAAYGRRVDTITSGGYETQKFLNQLRSDRIAKRMYGGDAIINATAALALYYGKRHLARWKDPLWSGTITVVGYINGSGGNEIPASEIEAGKVLDIADYIANEILPSDTLDYPRVIITATSYDADTETCVISFGPLDEFQMIQAENRYFVSYDTPATSGDTDAGGKKDNLNWKRQYGLKPGTAMWDEAVRLGKKAFLAKYPNLKRVRKK